MDDIFKKIIQGEIPSSKIYEDDICLAILDVNPFQKGHTLVISKENKNLIEDLKKGTFEHMTNIAKIVSKKMRTCLKANDTNILINNGPIAGQEVPHVHIHVIPRFKEKGQLWEVKKEKYSDGEMEKFKKLLTITKEDIE